MAGMLRSLCAMWLGGAQSRPFTQAGWGLPWSHLRMQARAGAPSVQAGRRSVWLGR